jgi:hypothetical protein
MSRILASVVALAWLIVLALPGSATAADQRAGALRADDQAMTDVSSYRRYWGPRYGWGVGRPYWRPRYAWGYGRPYWRPRYAWGYGRPYWRPRYAAWGYPAPYWRPRYAFYRPYPYFYRPFWRPRPVLAFSIGFGPRWGW